jgi:hypothetical protein
VTSKRAGTTADHAEAKSATPVWFRLGVINKAAYEGCHESRRSGTGTPIIEIPARLG